MKLFFFTSTIDNEVKNVVTIGTSNARRARRLASIKFLEWGYKGSPKRLAL